MRESSTIDQPPAPGIETLDLPESVQLAATAAGLHTFLENVTVGFHWRALELLADGVYILDREYRIMYWSGGAERITGYAAAHVLGRRCRDNILRHVDATGKCLCEQGCPMQALILDGVPREAELFLHHREGHRVPVRVRGWPVRDLTGQVIGALETFSDRTQRVADLARIQELQAAAFCDPLTGIANRRFVENALAGRLAEYAHSQMPFGLILCDVDHFKQFNDNYGHAAGDAVLRMVARTLASACQSYDLAARWGGEEFGVLAGGDARRVYAFAEQLRALVAASNLQHFGQPLHVTVSVGAVAVQPSDDAGTLFSRVDALMYQSKARGRDRVTCDHGGRA